MSKPLDKGPWLGLLLIILSTLIVIGCIVMAVKAFRGTVHAAELCNIEISAQENADYKFGYYGANPCIRYFQGNEDAWLASFVVELDRGGTITQVAIKVPGKNISLTDKKSLELAERVKKAVKSQAKNDPLATEAWAVVKPYR